MTADNDKHIWREASELGLAPGTFPASVTLDGITYQREDIERDTDGDVTAVNYRSGDYRLTVFND